MECYQRERYYILESFDQFIHSFILIKIDRDRVSVIAQFNNADLVCHIQSHLIVVHRKNGCVHICTVVEGIDCDARYVVIV